MMDYLAAERAIFAHAAAGDAEAQRTLADCALLSMNDGLTAREALVAAEVFARLAASHGGGPALALLSGVLLCRADDVEGIDRQRANALRWEAVEFMDRLAVDGSPHAAPCLISTLTKLADAGDELAAVELNRVAVLYPESLGVAAQLANEKAAPTIN